jgi:fermentation-respiration switch protein FrsA (DUF1100 family)
MAGGYLGVSLLLLFLENALLYHPVPAATEWLDPPNGRVVDVELPGPDGVRLHAWWCPQEGAEGAVLYCHGNAGNLSHRGHGISRWQEWMNQAVLIFDYPGYGKSEGKPSEAGCYAAADAAYAWLTQQAGVPAEQVLIYGGSLGGGVAVDLASRRPHRGLVLVSAFTSVPDMAQKLYPWLPARWLVRNRFDNLGKIGRCTCPVFIAHGDEDCLVPFAQGRRLFAAANEPKFFHAMPGHDHNDGPDRAFYANLRKFLAEAEVPAAKEVR